MSSLNQNENQEGAADADHDEHLPAQREVRSRDYAQSMKVLSESVVKALDQEARQGAVHGGIFEFRDFSMSKKKKVGTRIESSGIKQVYDYVLGAYSGEQKNYTDLTGCEDEDFLAIYQQEQHQSETNGTQGLKLRDHVAGFHCAVVFTFVWLLNFSENCFDRLVCEAKLGELSKAELEYLLCFKESLCLMKSALESISTINHDKYTTIEALVQSTCFASNSQAGRAIKSFQKLGSYPKNFSVSGGLLWCILNQLTNNFEIIQNESYLTEMQTQNVLIFLQRARASRDSDRTMQFVSYLAMFFWAFAAFVYQVLSLLRRPSFLVAAIFAGWALNSYWVDGLAQDLIDQEAMLFNFHRLNNLRERVASSRYWYVYSWYY